MTKRLGLTPAMRRALHAFPVVSGDMFRRLLDLGLIEDPVKPFVRRHAGYCVSPRGHAALDAPTMTQAEYDVLAALAAGNVLSATHHSAVLTRCKRRGWVHDATVSIPIGLTPTGRTALNNVRAAMPGEWRP